MRLTLVIASLDSGGAERVLCLLANCWAERGHDVTLLTTSAGPSFYHLDARVRRTGLGTESTSQTLAQGLRANVTRIRTLRRAIAQSCPDIVVSFLDATNVVTICATTGMRLPVLVSERVDPFHNTQLPRIWRMLRRLSYPFAARVIVQTKGVRDRMIRTLGGNVIAIPNPVVDPGVRHRGLGTDLMKPNWIIGMGRLTAQKGFDMLLHAFAQLASRYPDWGVRILGVGPDYAALQQQIRDLRLEDRAFLLGRSSEPYQLLAESSLFVMSSRFEGFPNALCEAMACGLPVISFDCPSGPSEIIRNGVDGILTPKEDVAALAAAMDQLMGDPEKRNGLSMRSPEIIERFGTERVLDRWEEVFTEVRRDS